MLKVVVEVVAPRVLVSHLSQSWTALIYVYMNLSEQQCWSSDIISRTKVLQFASTSLWQYC